MMKEGDRVRCINNTASFGRLTVGGIYTVSKAFDGTLVVIVNDSYHMLERFVPFDEEPAPL